MQKITEYRDTAPLTHSTLKTVRHRTTQFFFYQQPFLLNTTFRPGNSGLLNCSGIRPSFLNIPIINSIFMPFPFMLLCAGVAMHRPKFYIFHTRFERVALNFFGVLPLLHRRFHLQSLHYVPLPSAPAMWLVRITSWRPEFNGSHFWLTTQLYPQNDRTGWRNGVNYDVFTHAPLLCLVYI